MPKKKAPKTKKVQGQKRQVAKQAKVQRTREVVTRSENPLNVIPTVHARRSTRLAGLEPTDSSIITEPTTPEMPTPTTPTISAPIIPTVNASQPIPANMEIRPIEPNNKTSTVQQTPPQVSTTVPTRTNIEDTLADVLLERDTLALENKALRDSAQRPIIPDAFHQNWRLKCCT